MKENNQLILIVDDNPTNLDSLVQTLKDDYRLGIAKDGQRALEYAEKFLPDLIILDILMPGMDGYEVCSRLKSSSRTKNIPVIFITAMSETEDKTKGFEVGALDYITKPFHAAEVKARIQTHLSLQEAREREIAIASKIQRTLLLGAVPNEKQDIEIAQLSVASQKVDGDFIDFFEQSSLCIDVVVGDVMGKGIPAALVGAAMKSQFLRVLNNMLRDINKYEIPAIEDIVTGVHSGMISQLKDLETFVTLFYARFDLDAYQMTYVDCGHMPSIHYVFEEKSCFLLKGSNKPLGFSDNNFKSVSLNFKPGDLFVLYSDGLTEAQNSERVMYGEDRLFDFIQANSDNPPQAIIEKLWENIVQFSGSEIFDDDVTCVIVKIKDS